MVLRIFFLLWCAVSLVACQSSGKNVYEPPDDPKKLDPDARPSALPKLKARAKAKRARKLYQVTPAHALALPPDLVASANEKVQAAVTVDLTDETILPRIVGARIVKQGEKSWLEIEAEADYAWRAMREFWSVSGIDLIEYNPEAGLMETDWIDEPEVTDDGESAIKTVSKQLVTSLTRRNTTLNKYRLRFERLGDARTALHVSHRWTARKAISTSRKKISQFDWVELPSDPERVAEFLQNIALLFDQTGTASG